MYIKRTIENVIKNATKSFPVVVLTGARQVGKSTLFENLLDKNRQIISLDNPTLRKTAKEDPEKFLQIYHPPIVIDEIQYAPELFPYIKIIVDKNKTNGQFWLTGSQNFTMMQNITESLAGRCAIIPINNLSYQEIKGYSPFDFNFDIDKLMIRKKIVDDVNVLNVFDYIYKGFYPKLYNESNVDHNLFYQSYIDTYITRDIRLLKNIENEVSFLKFLNIVACRTATNLNYETLANEADITGPTAKAWLSLLVSSGLVRLIEPYTANYLKRIVKSPRMYMTDTGLICHLMGWSSKEVVENSYMSGALFETYVVNEISKSYINQGKRPPLYFYRNNSQQEIDLIIEENKIVHPVEIKKSANPKNPLKNFKSIDEKVGTGFVVCLCNEIVPLHGNNYLLPVSLI